MREVTVDTMAFRGSGIVTVAQPTRGHRFTLDSILLADFCRIRPRDRVLEAGAGTGIISLLLASRYPRIMATAIELDQEAAELCWWNVHTNGLSGRVTVIHRDIADLARHLKAGSFDVIVANPPYTRSGTGRTSPLANRRSARHAGAAGLAPWIELLRFLKDRGRFFLVFASSGAAALLSELRAKKLEPKRVRWVHPGRDRSASLVLIEAVKGGGTGLEILPPLVMHDRNGGSTREINELYGIRP